MAFTAHYDTVNPTDKKVHFFGMSEEFLIELHGLMEIADIKEEDVLKAMRNIAKTKNEEVPF